MLNVLELERLFNERYFEPSMDVPTFYRQVCTAAVASMPPMHGCDYVGRPARARRAAAQSRVAFGCRLDTPCASSPAQ